MTHKEALKVMWYRAAPLLYVSLFFSALVFGIAAIAYFVPPAPYKPYLAVAYFGMFALFAWYAFLRAQEVEPESKPVNKWKVLITSGELKDHFGTLIVDSLHDGLYTVEAYNGFSVELYLNQVQFIRKESD